MDWKQWFVSFRQNWIKFYHNKNEMYETPEGMYQAFNARWWAEEYPKLKQALVNDLYVETNNEQDRPIVEGLFIQSTED